MKKQESKELTRAELEVMQILWNLDGGLVNEVIELMPEPKPAYNTVSTVVRILEKKGFVTHEDMGRMFKYIPLLSREQYTEMFMSNVMNRFFDNSFAQMVSFFARNEKLSTKELDEILEILNSKK